MDCGLNNIEASNSNTGFNNSLDNPKQHSDGPILNNTCGHGITTGSNKRLGCYKKL